MKKYLLIIITNLIYTSLFSAEVDLLNVDTNRMHATWEVSSNTISFTLENPHSYPLSKIRLTITPKNQHVGKSIILKIGNTTPQTKTIAQGEKTLRFQITPLAKPNAEIQITLPLMEQDDPFQFLSHIQITAFLTGLTPHGL